MREILLIFYSVEAAQQAALGAWALGIPREQTPTFWVKLTWRDIKSSPIQVHSMVHEQHL